MCIAHCATFQCHYVKCSNSIRLIFKYDCCTLGTPADIAASAPVLHWIYNSGSKQRPLTSEQLTMSYISKYICLWLACKKEKNNQRTCQSQRTGYVILYQDHGKLPSSQAFEAKAKARPLRGQRQGPKNLSSSCPRGRGQCSRSPSLSRSGLNPTRTTPPCYNNTTLGNRLYTQHKGPNVTNHIYLTCKNYSHDKCAADCEHCVSESRTKLFW